MAIDSIGYAGSIGWQAWAQMARDLGTDYGIDGVDDLKVLIKAAAVGEITVSAGTAHGQGIIDTSDATLTIAGLTAADTWYTVVVRRDWTGGPGAEVTTILALAGNAAKAIAASRLAGAGVIDDQPIALVHRGSTLDQVVDLRCWWGNGGLYAASVDALAYLGRPGSSVRVGGSTFSRRLGAQWVELPDSIHADRVTEGVLSPSRIPDLDASKVSGGVLARGRIPALPASHIAEGVLDPARIPTIPSDKVAGRWTQDVTTTGIVEASTVNATVALAGTVIRSLTSVEAGAKLRSVGPGSSTGSANVVMTPNGWLDKVASLRAAKVAIEDLTVPDALAAVAQLRPRTWFDKRDSEALADAVSSGDPAQIAATVQLRRIPGFIAEEVAEVEGLSAELVTRGAEGELLGVAYDRIPALLTVAIQQLMARVEAQAAQIDVLTLAVEALGGALPTTVQED